MENLPLWAMCCDFFVEEGEDFLPIPKWKSDTQIEPIFFWNIVSPMK
jgi:hypothetical protein